MPPAKKTTELHSTVGSIGADLPNQLNPEGGPRRAATVVSKRNGSGRIFQELNGKRPPSNPNSFLVRLGRSHFCGGTLGASRSFYLSKELHSDRETEVPLCTLSHLRRHPPSVKTWDLLRSSTYQQHRKPNCCASCRVPTPAARL